MKSTASQFSSFKRGRMLRYGTLVIVVLVLMSVFLGNLWLLSRLRDQDHDVDWPRPVQIIRDWLFPPPPVVLIIHSSSSMTVLDGPIELELPDHE
jgi:hypothetical protein